MSVSLLIKPASAACNLRCDYCFYRDIGENREIPNCGMMSPETLEILTRKAFATASHSCTFAFQGGEPTLAGLDFFKKALAFQKKYNKKHIPVNNVLQTNGTLLNEEWAEFLSKNQFLVGLSLDGCEALHDFHRGAGTHKKVLAAAELLKRHQVSFNVLAVVTRETVGQVSEMYAFFREQGLSWLQFIPCLDPLGASGEDRLTAEGYGQFLKELFDLWYRDIQAGNFIYIQYFENLVGLLRGCPPGTCASNGFCSIQHVIEADGSVYPCDFYALDPWKLGNIRTDDLGEFVRTERARQFVARSHEVPKRCKLCRYAPVCRGGCRRDYVTNPRNQAQENRLCRAYRMFFDYAWDRLLRLAYPPSR